MRAMRQAKVNATWGTDLRAAVERDGGWGLIGQIQLYCDNQACAARQIDVNVKVESDELEALANRPPVCPLCGDGARLLLDAVETLGEAVEHKEWEARISVNMQRHRIREARRLGVEPSLIGVSLDQALDDSLPD
jgi:hypothetical protein